MKLQNKSQIVHLSICAREDYRILVIPYSDQHPQFTCGTFKDPRLSRISGLYWLDGEEFSEDDNLPTSFISVGSNWFDGVSLIPHMLPDCRLFYARSCINIDGTLGKVMTGFIAKTGAFFLVETEKFIAINKQFPCVEELDEDENYANLFGTDQTRAFKCIDHTSMLASAHEAFNAIASNRSTNQPLEDWSVFLKNSSTSKTPHRPRKTLKIPVSDSPPIPVDEEIPSLLSEEYMDFGVFMLLSLYLLTGKKHGCKSEEEALTTICSSPLIAAQQLEMLFDVAEKTAPDLHLEEACVLAAGTFGTKFENPLMWIFNGETLMGLAFTAPQNQPWILEYLDSWKESGLFEDDEPGRSPAACMADRFRCYDEKQGTALMVACARLHHSRSFAKSANPDYKTYFKLIPKT